VINETDFAMLTVSRCIAVLLAATLAGCYVVRPSAGGGEVTPTGMRSVRAADVLLPSGYRIEVGRPV